MKLDFSDFEAIEYYHPDYSFLTVDHLCCGLKIFVLHKDIIFLETGLVLG